MRQETYVELDTHEFTSFRFRRTLQELSTRKQFAQGWAYILQCEKYLPLDVWLQRSATRFMISMGWDSLKNREKLPDSFEKLFSTFTLLYDEPDDQKLLEQWGKMRNAIHQKEKRRQISAQLRSNEFQTIQRLYQEVQSQDPIVLENLARSLQENIRSAIFQRSPIPLDRIETLLDIYWCIPTSCRGYSQYNLLRSILWLPKRLRQEGGWKRRASFSITRFSDFWDLRNLRVEEYERGATYQNADGSYQTGSAPVVHLFSLIAREVLFSRAYQNRQAWCLDWLQALLKDFPDDEWLYHYTFALMHATKNDSHYEKTIRQLLQTQKDQTWAWAVVASAQEKRNAPTQEILGLYIKGLFTKNAYQTKDFIPKVAKSLAENNWESLAKSLFTHYVDFAQKKNIALSSTAQKLMQEPWMQNQDEAPLTKEAIRSTLQKLALDWEQHFYADVPWQPALLVTKERKADYAQVSLLVWDRNEKDFFLTKTRLTQNYSIHDRLRVQIRPQEIPLHIINIRPYQGIARDFPTLHSQRAVLMRVVAERNLLRFATAEPMLYHYSAPTENYQIGQLFEIQCVLRFDSRNRKQKEIFYIKTSSKNDPLLRKDITHERIGSISMQGVGRTSSDVRIPATFVNQHQLETFDYVTGSAHWHYDRARKEWFFCMDSITASSKK